MEGSGSGSGGSEHGSSSKPAFSIESAGGRLRFKVELQPGETTVVSWKDLLKQANLSNPPESSSIPSFDAQHNFDSQLLPPPPPPSMEPSSRNQTTENVPISSQAQVGSDRLSAVIEKIERLNAGNWTSDEESLALDSVPADDEYDTADSFIDDTELDDYFQVDNSVIKHDGFYVNHGKLEHIEPIISLDLKPKKRGHKDLIKDGGSDDGHNPRKILKKSDKVLKAQSSIKSSSTDQSHKEDVLNIQMQSRDPMPTLAAVIQGNEGPRVEEKSALLKKAFRELEEIVAEFGPPSLAAQDPDNASQAVKRRLPLEIKQKLAEVSTIVIASYGKVSTDVINHLMSIVGHLMDVKKLKEALKKD